MEKKIVIFKSFEEQEDYFLSFFARLTPSERLRRLADLQKKNYNDFMKPGKRCITIRTNPTGNGH
jgi:hypothetical protein